MQFKVQTLVDITETNARRGEESLPLKQQHNYLTFLQTLGLRVNISQIQPPIVEEVQLKDYTFGSVYTGKHRVWTFIFTVEYVGALDINMLQHDFDLVPFISNLTETPSFSKSAFRSTDAKECNIAFSVIDV